METTAFTRVTASERLLEAFATVRALELPDTASAVLRAGLDVADIVRTLDADDDVVIAAMLQPLLDAKLIDPAAADQRFGTDALRLARNLSQLGEFGLRSDWRPEQGLEPGQAEALRKMLLAVIGDVRLVVVRLAGQLQKMRAAKSLDPMLQRKLATETREVYAPLANRLGVWQLKWELEDLAFRYLQPEDYRHIAAALKTRRSERERYMEELQALLQSELRGAGIEALIEGRPKHIYSIWRKMQAKHLAFEQLMDVRAARVLVNTVAECYAALGVVHSLWQFIAGEFDDYIATPKDNFYRSIHTAVIGPGAQAVEIQIRTHEMHANSERGVASHWRYKEGGRVDQAYERPGAATRREIFSIACGSICFRTASMRSRPRARSSMYRWAARPWISPIKSIRIWVIAPAERRSTGAWWGSTIKSRTAKPSRSLPRRRRIRRAIGCPPNRAFSRAHGIATRCAPGSASRTRLRTRRKAG
jgi:(p)ppGpp synthase/HD superfamily hydrolase